jgi:Ca2+-binding EF-hand superfamily protein
MTIENLPFTLSEELRSLVPENKLTPLIDAFTQLDADSDGKIEIEEFLHFYLAEDKIRLTQQFEALDGDRDGCIEFEEFVMAREPNYQILKKFRELDLNHDGLLSIDEAIVIADRLVFPLSNSQIRTIIHEVDRDGDGQITYYEYLGAIAHVGLQ